MARKDVSRKSEVVAMSSQNWWQYTMGYKEAGDLLLQNTLGGGRQHVLVFPIIFMYRHYIELQLKEIILNNWAYLDISEDFPTYHNIEKLWAICRDTLHKMDKAVDSEFTKKGTFLCVVLVEPVSPSRPTIAVVKSTAAYALGRRRAQEPGERECPAEEAGS